MYCGLGAWDEQGLWYQSSVLAQPLRREMTLCQSLVFSRSGHTSEACGTLLIVLCPEIGPASLTVEIQSLNHWTTRNSLPQACVLLALTLLVCEGGCVMPASLSGQRSWGRARSPKHLICFVSKAQRVVPGLPQAHTQTNGADLACSASCRETGIHVYPTKGGFPSLSPLAAHQVSEGMLSGKDCEAWPRVWGWLSARASCGFHKTQERRSVPKFNSSALPPAIHILRPTNTWNPIHFSHSFQEETFPFKMWPSQTSLVVPWLRIRLPMKGAWVWSLIWGDPTCRTATKAMPNYGAQDLHLLKPVRLEAVLHKRRSHHNEEWPLLAATRESPSAATKTQHNQQLNE